MSESNGLPEGWEPCSLDSIGVLFCGQSPPASSVNRSGHGVAYVTGPEQWDGSSLNIDKWTTTPTRIVPDECVFITVKGAGVGTLFPGKACAIGRDVYAYKPAEGVLCSFVEHSLRFNIGQVVQHAKGDIPGLSKSHILDHKMGIPPLPEQHRIVAKIEELFSHLDGAVASLQRAKANLKRYRASVLKSAVEGKLTEEWRKEHPQAEDGQMLLDRILRERREKWERDQLAKFKEKGEEPPKNWQSKYVEPAREAGLHNLPVSWVWASALEICERVENGNTPPSDEMTSGSGDVPFIKVYNITRDGRLDFTIKPTFVSKKTHEERLGRSRVLPNDVLINIVGPPLGKVALVPEAYPEWNMNQAIVLFRTSSGVLSRYLLLCLMSDEVLRWITRTAKATAGQFNISVANSRLLPIPLPPLAEQQQIVALVEERLSQINAAEKTIDTELIRAKRLRQSILKRAFEGKLVPQDPSDEPASVLLERIQLDRTKASRDGNRPTRPRRARRSP